MPFSNLINQFAYRLAGTAPQVDDPGPGSRVGESDRVKWRVIATDGDKVAFSIPRIHLSLEYVWTLAQDVFAAWLFFVDVGLGIV